MLDDNKKLQKLREKRDGGRTDRSSQVDGVDKNSPSSTIRQFNEDNSGYAGRTERVAGDPGIDGEVSSRYGRLDFETRDGGKRVNQVTPGDTGGRDESPRREEIPVTNVKTGKQKRVPAKEVVAEPAPKRSFVPKIDVSDELFSQQEAALARDTLEKVWEAILDGTDDGITATNKAHVKAQIWSTVETDDILFIVDMQLGAAKVNREAARATRAMLYVHKHIRIGTIVVPRAWQTWQFYAQYGFYIPGLEAYTEHRKQRKAMKLARRRQQREARYHTRSNSDTDV